MSAVATPAGRVVRGLVPPPFAFAPLAGRRAAPSEADAAAARAEAALDAATAEAHAHGLAAGRAEAEAEAAVRIEALEAELAEARAATAEATTAAADHERQAREAAERVAALWTETTRALEPRLVELALRVAEGVLGAPPSEAARQAATDALAAAVDRLATGNPVTVALHPVDYLQLQESGFAETLSGAHDELRWESDPALAPGDWTVTSSDAAIHRVAAEALAGLRSRLGLDAAP